MCTCVCLILVAYFKVLCRYFHGGIEENYENYQSVWLTPFGIRSGLVPNASQGLCHCPFLEDQWGCKLVASFVLVTNFGLLSVDIALGYGLDDRGSRVRFPAGAGNFSLHGRVQNGSGSHSASYPMGTRGSFPWGWSGRSVKLTTHLHLVPRSKNEWSCTSTPQYAFMVCAVQLKQRDNFSFHFMHRGLLVQENSIHPEVCSYCGRHEDIP
jgi:hypothetical protein